MKGTLKTVLPRGATRRKLSTVTVSNQSTPYFFESAQPPSTQPRLITTSLALTTTTTSPNSSATSKAPAAHPKYTTNSSHPTYQTIPPIFFIPSAQSPQGILHASFNSKQPTQPDRLSCKLDLGAYGIPKRRRRDDGNGGDSSDPSSSKSPSPQVKDDPALYNLSVQVGEDAYFTRSNALGVADGVGGWKHSKQFSGESYSALLAKKLMHYCSIELAAASSVTSSTNAPAPHSPTATSTTSPASSPTPAHSNLDPIQILQSSYDRCMEEAQAMGHVTGSTTALLAVLADNELRIAHLGDCAVCLVRDGEMVYRSEEMQHSFNYPFQLGPKSQSTPSAHAQRITIPVQPNDILILASDGMGDNLWDEDVLDEVRRFVGQSQEISSSSTTSLSSSSSQSAGSRATGHVTNSVLAQRLSEALASRAKRVSERTSGHDRGSAGVFSPKQERPTSDSKGKAKDDSTPPIEVSAQSGSTAQAAQRAAALEAERQAEVQLERQRREEEQASLEAELAEEEDEALPLDEIPFGRKAKEAGLRFVGGKNDDISVLVAVISGSSPSTTSMSDTTSAHGSQHPPLNLNLDRKFR